MVLPGLMDSHTHPTSASMFEFDHAVPEMESIDDVWSTSGREHKPYRKDRGSL